MASNSRSKRRSSIAPITVDELLGAAGMSGFVSFLNVKPEDYGRPGVPPAPAAETAPASMVEAGSATTVEPVSPAMVEAVPDSIVEVGPTTIVEVGSTSTVEPESASTVEVETNSTVAAEPVAPVFWTIEGIGGAFPQSRLRRIERAQDALTHVEESVYDVLWGVKDHSRDRSRRTVMGYEEIARQARASKRGVVDIVQRLIQKGFIEIAREPQTFGARRPTEYRVHSYAAVRESQRARNRLWTIRTGNGIGYAHPLTLTPQPLSTVEAAPASTIEVGEPSTVEAREPSTVEAASTRSYIDKKNSQNNATTATPAVVVAAIRDAMGRTDDDAAARIVEACREFTPDIADEEIAHFIRQEGPALQRNKGLDNPMGVLIRHIPRCCRGESLRLYREARRAAEHRNRAQLEAWVRDARQIAADPEASPVDRDWAEDILRSYGAGAGKA